MWGGTGVEHPGDGGVVHESQRLAFGFEAGNHLTGIHAGFDQLERDTPVHRLLLFGQPDFAHAAFADFLQETIAADYRAAGLRGGHGPRGRGFASGAGGGIRIVLARIGSQVKVYTAASRLWEYGSSYPHLIESG